MAKKTLGSGDPCYVVVMRRWGDRERHAYVLGVYRQKHRAQTEGHNEEDYRGGKYRAEIVEMCLDFDQRAYCKTIQAVSCDPDIAPAPWARSDTEEADPDAPYAGHQW